MNFGDVLSYGEEAGVASLVLNRPEAGNRIHVPFLEAFREACDYLEDYSKCRMLVVRGSGSHFCRGIDFSAFEVEQPMDIHGFSKWEKAVARLENLPMLTVAAVHGNIVGAGVQLMLACDYRMAATGSRLSLPEVRMGFLPGMAVFRLAKYLGLGRTKRLLLTGETLDVAESERIGLIDRVVDDLDEGLAGITEEFSGVHPTAVQMARRLLNESFHTCYEDAIGHFLAAQHRCVSQPTFVQSVVKGQEGER